MKHYYETDRIYKDSVRKKLSGVCAGLARYWNQPTWLIRVAAIAFLLTFPLPAAMAYLLATLILPSR